MTADWYELMHLSEISARLYFGLHTDVKVPQCSQSGNRITYLLKGIAYCVTSAVIAEDADASGWMLTVYIAQSPLTLSCCKFVQLCNKL